MKFKNHLFKCFVILCLMVSCFNHPTRATSSIPNPTHYKYVNDYVGIMSSNGLNHLIRMGQDVELQTGAQVVVAIVSTTGDMPIEDYALKLFRSWGIGQADEDNGLLILLATSDQRWRIEVGRGLEGIIPDALSHRVMNQVAKPEFIAGNYEQGLINAYDTFSNIIFKDAGSTSTNPVASGKGFVPLLILLIILDVVLNRGRILSTFLQLLFISNIRRRGPWNGNDRYGGGGFGGGSSNGGGSSGGW